jgi:phage major head subunit gpT-like protein
MIINRSNLQTLTVGYQAAFQQGLGQAEPQWQQIAMTVPSTTAEEEYGWLDKLPGMREWLGDRVIKGITTSGYRIRNRDWEQTIAVERNDIEDDRYGLYGPMMAAMGEAAGAHPNELVFGLLGAGFATPCYDGQYFFDTDHPVLDADGVPQSVSNDGGGSGTAWYLLCLNRVVRPIIFQERNKIQFVARDRVDDEKVFMSKTFVYGADARYSVGYGFWQFAYGSKQTLDATAYAAAFTALEGMKGDYGRPLGQRPTHQLVPPGLRAAALELLNAERNAAGATNVWRGTTELIVSPWL